MKTLFRILSILSFFGIFAAIGGFDSGVIGAGTMLVLSAVCVGSIVFFTGCMKKVCRLEKIERAFVEVQKKSA